VKPVLLVVDDEEGPSNPSGLSSRTNINVLLANSGEQLWSWLAAIPFASSSAISYDRHSGIDVLKCLKEIDPAIESSCSPHTRPRDRPQASAMGCDYLNKLRRADHA